MTTVQKSATVLFLWYFQARQRPLTARTLQNPLREQQSGSSSFLWYITGGQGAWTARFFFYLWRWQRHGTARSFWYLRGETRPREMHVFSGIFWNYSDLGRHVSFCKVWKDNDLGRQDFSCNFREDNIFFHKNNLERLVVSDIERQRPWTAGLKRYIRGGQRHVFFGTVKEANEMGRHVFSGIFGENNDQQIRVFSVGQV